MNKRLNEQLPLHSPDPGAWQRLTAQLDAMDAEAAFHQKLEQLPLHAPNKGTWTLIQHRLSRIAYYKTVIRIAVAAAAIIGLLISVSRISDNAGNKPNSPQLSVRELHNNQSSGSIQSTKIASQIDKTGKVSDRTSASSRLTSNRASSSFHPDRIVVEASPDVVNQEMDLASDMEVMVPRESFEPFVVEPNFIPDTSLPAGQTIFPVFDPSLTLFHEDRKITPKTPAVKYYTPNEPVPGKINQNHFALAMNYLPENINNGTNNSLFHNVDLTASYNKEKVRFNTSVGMAYNEQQLNFDMNYNINSAVTAVGPGGHLDTVGYNVAKVESQYQGTEKHQYFTYNLGFGRRIFSYGKFSTWLNAGAGFGIRLNNPDLISSTEKTIKGQYNALITSDNTSKPVYNDVNVNFVTAIDFNYKIFNKLSLTFSPTSRWYFKPVLTKDRQATDELTVGFRTGVKYDF